MTKRCLVMEVGFASEPATWLDRLLPALRPLVEALRPESMFTCTPGGRVSRDRKVKWSTVEEWVAQPTTGTLSMHTYEGPARRTVSVDLRHAPSVSSRFQSSSCVWFGAEAPRESMAELTTAGDSFIAFAARVPGVQYGAITALDNLEQASCEVTGTATDEEKQPAQFRARRDHDWKLKFELGALCRRLYWKTLLGPTLAAAAGGAAAARAAGALDVRELDGSIVFQAMPGPPRDSLDPEFLAATTALRRWLWPHTFKNPLDAAGFEAEVGLPPAPTPSVG